MQIFEISSVEIKLRLRRRSSAHAAYRKWTEGEVSRWLARNQRFIIRHIWIIFEISFAAFSLQFDTRHLWRYVGGWSTQWSGTSPSYAMATVLSARKQAPSHMLLSLLVTDRQAQGYAYRMPCGILIYCAAVHNSHEETPYLIPRVYRLASSEPRQGPGPIFKASIQSGRWS